MTLLWDQFLEDEANLLSLLSDERAVFLLWYSSQEKCLTQNEWINTELYRSRNYNPREEDKDPLDGWLRNRFRKIFQHFREMHKDRLLSSTRNARDILHSHLRALYSEKLLETASISVNAHINSQELWILLDELDYENQIHSYNTERKKFNPTLGCIVKAEDNLIQRWLIKRLVKRLNILDNPQSHKHFLLDAYNPVLSRCGVDKIWNLFLEEDINNKDQENILTSIRESFKSYLNNNKTVLITVYGIERISSKALEGLYLIWKEAIELNAVHLPGRVDSKVVLFLSQGDMNSYLVNLEAKDKEIDDFLCSMLHLDSFEINAIDWIDWLRKPECREKICNVFTEERYNDLILINDRQKIYQSQILLNDIAQTWGMTSFAEYKIAWDLNYVA